MHPLLEMILSNALVATLLAVLAALVSHVVRRPALTHALWLLVLLKLVTPPLVPVQLPWSLASATDGAGTRAHEAAAKREQLIDVVEADDLALLGEFLVEPELQQAEPPSLVEEKPAEMMTSARAPAVVFSSEWLLWLWPAGSLAWLAWT